VNRQSSLAPSLVLGGRTGDEGIQQRFGITGEEAVSRGDDPELAHQAWPSRRACRWAVTPRGEGSAPGHGEIPSEHAGHGERLQAPQARSNSRAPGSQDQAKPHRQGCRNLHS